MTSSLTPVSRLVDGLHFAEAPRWHAGRLWFSDIFARRVMTVTEDGDLELIVQFGDDVLPCGLGFLADGRALVVNMHRPEILRIGPDGEVSRHADLSAHAVGGLNDMVVDAAGRAYVGSMGTVKGNVPRPLPHPPDGNIILVEPDGAARVVADELDAPNGPAISIDGGRYVVAEFPSSRLVSFRIQPDGSLVERALFADLRPGSADGIAIDRDGAVWTASPREHECRRVVEGGRRTHTVRLGDDMMPLACCLGGSDGRTLFILSAVGGEAAVVARTNTSVIDTVRVDVAAW